MTSGFICRRLALGVMALSFCAFSVAQEVPANIKAALKKADAAVQAIIKVPKNKRTFANTIGALDDLSAQVDNDTSLTIFMQNVHGDAKVRESSRAAEEVVSNWYIEVGKNEALYKAVKAYADTKPKLSGEQARLLMFTMRDYKRAGMGLPKAQRDRLKQIEIEMNKLSISFGQNIADDETKVFLTKEELEGVPEEVLKRLPQSAGLYVVGMDGPTFNAVLDYAEKERTRQVAWTAFKRRGGQKNVEVLEQLVKLRAEAAKLLGYKTTADYETEVRMAKNAATVKKFYDDLRPIVRKKAELDMAEFTEAKRKHTGDANAKLMPWDYAFYKNLLKKEKYAVDSEKVAEYFPVQSVINGLFSITQSLYNVEYRDVTSKAKSLGLPVWHPDVKLYEVHDKATKQMLGRFYLDLYPRPNKYNHAAVWGLQPRKVWANGKTQTALAAMVTNFTKPTADKPSLMPHDEVETFFHEFGHALHHMFAKASYARFSGTAVARDFVEAPSQMMENWVWSPEVLRTFAKHYKTGEVLPNELLEGMKAARTLGSGIETEHQFYYGLVDQAYHTDADGVVDTTKIANDLFHQVELYDYIPNVFFQSSFGHLTGYQAAYYGYMWSLVYAQDMFQRFEELGLLSPKAGAYYREKILARGGTMDEMAMLKDYLGREPKMDAFLKHLGLRN